MPAYELVHAYETVNLHHGGGVTKIELNRPETMNAWNAQFGLDLLAAVQRVAEDDDVRAVQIVGAGRGFSSGADLKQGFEPGPNGRSAGTISWAGIFNSYYWLDPARRVAGVIMTQILPFADPAAVRLYGRFERGVYALTEAR